jgi:hypothetical protein
VAARVRERHLEVHVGLLGGLHAVHDGLAVVAEAGAAGVAVQQELGAIQLAGERGGRVLGGFLVS